MPLYEYECRVCGVRFERMQHFNDEPVRTCPECGGQVQRLIHPVGIVFKGPGFYATDHRSSSSTGGAGRKSAPKDKESGAGSAEKGEGV